MQACFLLPRDIFRRYRTGLKRMLQDEADIGKTMAEKQKKQFAGTARLKVKKLGVIGLGAIGVLVANASKTSWNGSIMVYDPFLSR